MTKNLLSVFAIAISSFAVAQNVAMPYVGSAQYEQMKIAGTLPTLLHQVFNTSMAKSNNNPQAPSAVSSTTTTTPASCGCLMAIDSTFGVAPFNNGTPPEFRNDDGSANVILPFQFNFYGDTMTNIWINNNGNISFGVQYSTFTGSTFPNTNFQMIAPFWADVDTRQALQSGIVHYKVTPTALIVRWDTVGYFNVQADKRNTFQLIITDGNDPLIPGGNNVAFCYGDMQWTTGSASQGINGFGGSPAVIGLNRGDGINYFQIMESDHDSIDYDGPYNLPDGVSFLDNQSYFFTTATGNGNNVPPIALNNTCDSIYFDAGDDSTTVQFSYIGPEAGQNVTLQMAPNADATVISNTSGNVATITIQVNNTANRSLSNLQIIATDNFGSATIQNQVIVPNANGITAIKDVQVEPLTLSPNPTTGLLNIKLAKAGQVKVINTLGEVIANENTNTTNVVSLDLTNNAKGIYFVQYNNGKEIITRKFIKE